MSRTTSDQGCVAWRSPKCFLWSLNQNYPRSTPQLQGSLRNSGCLLPKGDVLCCKSSRRTTFTCLKQEPRVSCSVCHSLDLTPCVGPSVTERLFPVPCPQGWAGADREPGTHLGAAALPQHTLLRANPSHLIPHCKYLPPV